MFSKELRKFLGPKNEEVSEKWSISKYTQIEPRDLCMINSDW
jgi:hypothetical protein